MFADRFTYLYVEPSTYCNLKCPRCPRTESPDSYDLEHLDSEILARLLNSSLWDNLETIEYGGNYGDPLMHPHLDELIALARDIRPSAKHLIHTSGNQNEKRWTRVLDQLTPQDSVLLSIDGLSKTNSQYRVGAHWEWIEKAIELCVDQVHTIWKFIVFSHNQDQILDTIKHAKRMGVHTFLLTKSHLFNGHWTNNMGMDPMAPNPTWIAQASNPGDRIEPKCQTQSMHYLAANGAYSPCCWTNSNVEMQYPISQEFGSVMKDSRLLQLKKEWKQMGPPICAKKCRASLSERSSHQQIPLDLSQSQEELAGLVDEFKRQ